MVIKEIEWINTIKGRVMEREEQKKQWEEEKQRRQEERKKRIEDQMRREENMKKREEEWRQKEDEKQKKWEEYMLQKLDIHPYLSEIDLCEHLIKYCQKNLRKTDEGKEGGAQSNLFELERQADELRKKNIEEALNKGKLMRAPTKEERQHQDTQTV